MNSKDLEHIERILGAAMEAPQNATRWYVLSLMKKECRKIRAEEEASDTSGGSSPEDPGERV